MVRTSLALIVKAGGWTTASSVTKSHFNRNNVWATFFLVSSRCSNNRYRRKAGSSPTSLSSSAYSYAAANASTGRGGSDAKSGGNDCLQSFRATFWSLIVFASVISGGFFLHDNTREFMNSTVQTTLDGSVPLTEVFFPSIVVCNINQIRKSFFDELGFYDNDTLVRIMYEDFIKGTMEHEEELRDEDSDPKRAAFYEVRSRTKKVYFQWESFKVQ